MTRKGTGAVKVRLHKFILDNVDAKGFAQFRMSFIVKEISACSESVLSALRDLQDAEVLAYEDSRQNGITISLL